MIVQCVFRSNVQESRLSQEQLADQVVSASEEKHKMTVELAAANKVSGEDNYMYLHT